ncbi:MAG: potassium channel protein [Deltaproteobacteria bacterium]|nr:potassium channel protein [Deltaproteobacteria bacterium]
MLRSRHPILDFLQERLVKALAIFVGTWLLGGLGLYLIGWTFHMPTEMNAPDGSADAGNWSLGNCLWMATMTVSTLGMGDLSMFSRLPVLGRQVVYAYMIAYTLISYLLVLYASAQTISYVVEGALGRYLETRRMQRDLNELDKHFVVCGLGSTGLHIVQELVKVKATVVGVDTAPEKVAHAKTLFPTELFLDGDGTQDDTLERIGIRRAAGFFAAMGEDKDNIIAVLAARQVNPAARVVARAQESQNIEKLKRVGANVTICPTQIGGMRMASEMVRPAVTTFLDTMLRSQNSTVRFENVILRENGPAAGRMLKELDLRGRTGLIVVATVKAGGQIAYNPGPDTRVDGGDAVVVITTPDQKRVLETLLNGA